MKKLFVFLLSLFCMNSAVVSEDIVPENINNGMIVRISEIEVYPKYLKEYMTFAKEVAETSVEKEDGVVSIYPMMIIKKNNQIRILEIYKDNDAYKKHIASEHFQKYKQGTLHMVKKLNLIDTYQLSEKNFNKIFKKADYIKKEQGETDKMIINFDSLNDTVIKNFYNGEKEISAKMYNDDKNRIMKAKLIPGASIGMHTHETSSEIIYILSGTGKAVLDGKTEEIKPGLCHYCPKGHSHSLINDGTEDLIFFAVVPQQ